MQTQQKDSTKKSPAPPKIAKQAQGRNSSRSGVSASRTNDPKAQTREAQNAEGIPAETRSQVLWASFGPRLDSIEKTQAVLFATLDSLDSRVKSSDSLIARSARDLTIGGAAVSATLIVIIASQILILRASRAKARRLQNHNQIVLAQAAQQPYAPPPSNQVDPVSSLKVHLDQRLKHALDRINDLEAQVQRVLADGRAASTDRFARTDHVSPPIVRNVPEVAEQVAVEIDERGAIRKSSALTAIAFAEMLRGRGMAAIRLNPERLIENSELRSLSNAFDFPSEIATAATYQTTHPCVVALHGDEFGSIQSRGSVERTSS